MNNSYRTAIVRKRPSLPLRVLINNNKINKNNKILDFGCGRGTDHTWLQSNGYNANGYDPYWNPIKSSLNKKYDIVLCSYVLNVVNANERRIIIKKLKDLTNKSGRIYLTVRRDIKKDYITKYGVHQYLVYLPYRIVKETSAYCIYEVNKND